MNDDVFGSAIMVSAEHIKDFEVQVKDELIRQVIPFVTRKILDSGHYHIVKMDMFREDSPFNVSVKFFLRGYLATAQDKMVVIPKIDYGLPETAKPCCMWCGSVLSLDKRGCCDTCGAPPADWSNIVPLGDTNVDNNDYTLYMPDGDLKSGYAPESY